MNVKPAANEGQESETAYGHAVVIGGSIAGLAAARVLAKHFARVTIVERDRLLDALAFRSGAPQARHAHVLRLCGQRILEQLFPGLIESLIAGGAETVNAGEEAEFFLFGQWRAPRYHSAIDSVAASRPLLEYAIRQRLAALRGVSLLLDREVLGLTTEKHGERVSGVRLRGPGRAARAASELAADLVLDASGRGSRAPQWLSALGFAPPPETVVDAFVGYATRLYRRPAAFREGWKTMYVIPTPPDSPRGGVIVPLEGNRWQVTLIGMGRDYPPADEAGFLTFAASLPSRRLYEAIQTAEPLTRPYGFQRNGNRLRHYDRLSRCLEGFLVVGDSVGALNPIHAQGMTVAALGSLALERQLQAQRAERPTGDLTGLARAFQRELGQVVAGPWQLATSTDRRWPRTAGAQRPLDEAAEQRLRYLAQVMRAMVWNPAVAEAFFHVQHMVEPLATLYRPEIVSAVLGRTRARSLFEVPAGPATVGAPRAGALLERGRAEDPRRTVGWRLEDGGRVC